MSYTYTQTTNKNGKARFYRVDENGKRKVISRTEYEANTTETAEPITETCTALVPADFWTFKPAPTIGTTAPSIEETALETVKAIISDMEGKHSNKVRLQETKKGIQIRYRNYAVCALVFDAEHTLTGIRFMGTTMETVNEVTVCEPASLSTYTDKVIEQVTFIDWWWANCFKKATA